MLLYGGGHANYAGNEVYVWDGATGAWGRGSLPSKLDANLLIPDNSAPQSAHTYDNNLYLQNNDMFLTFGGAAFPNGGNYQGLSGSSVVRTGPWLWDPAKADASKVGGTTGSGYDPNTPGGNMWTNRQGQWSGNQPPSFIEGTAAYRNEAGKDVVYVTADNFQSGWVKLYRYTLGDIKSGGIDTWEAIGGNSFTSDAYQGAGAIDTAHNLYVRTAAVAGKQNDLIVWSLTGASGSTPTINRSVELINADGSPFAMNSWYGLDFDQNTGVFYIWDGENAGTVWSFAAVVDGAGQPLSTWTVTPHFSSSPTQPNGQFRTGVLGKWQYVDELNAFVALDEFSTATGDASVWLYKPLALAVPEPDSRLLFLAGMLMVAVFRLRAAHSTNEKRTLPAGHFASHMKHSIR